MTFEEEIDQLIREGWREGRLIPQLDRHDRVFYKRFEGEPRCQINESKNMLAELRLWDFRKYGHPHGYEIVLRGEPLHCDYSVYISVPTNFETLDERLAAAFKMWRAANETASG